MERDLVKLGSIANITSSKRVYLSDYVSTGIPFYRSKEIIEKVHGKSISEELYIAEKRFNELKEKFGAPKKNDILVTSVGTLGVVYLVKDSDCFYFKDGNLIWLKDINDKVNPKYLHIWLSSNTGKKTLDETTIGTSQPAYTIVNLKKVIFPRPPLPIQNKIAAILSAYDDLIENNNRQIAILEKMAEEICREWFVRMRFPGREKVKFHKGVPEKWR